MSDSPLVLVERIGNTNFAKRIFCKACKEVVYKVSDAPSKVEIDRELRGLELHMKLQHDLDVGFFVCSDPKCTQPHHP